MKQKKGFTLIELLIVIAIIGILASIVLVSLNSARVKANFAAWKSSVQSVAPAAMLCRDAGYSLNATTTLGVANICNDAVNGSEGVFPNLPTACASVNIQTGNRNLDTWFYNSNCNQSGNYCTATCTSTGCRFTGAGGAAC